MPSYLQPVRRESGSFLGFSDRWIEPELMIQCLGLLPLGFVYTGLDLTQNLASARAQQRYVHPYRGNDAFAGTYASPWRTLPAHLTGGYQFNGSHANTGYLLAADCSHGPSSYNNAAASGEYQFTSGATGITISTYDDATGAEITSQDQNPHSVARQGLFLSDRDRAKKYATINLGWQPTAGQNYVGPICFHGLTGASDIVIRGINFEGYGGAAVSANDAHTMRLEDFVMGKSNQSTDVSTGNFNTQCLLIRKTGQLSVARGWFDTNVVDMFTGGADSLASSSLTLTQLAGVNDCSSSRNTSLHSDIFQSQPASNPDAPIRSMRYCAIQHVQGAMTSSDLTQAYTGKAAIFGGYSGTPDLLDGNIFVTDCGYFYGQNGVTADLKNSAMIFLPINLFGGGNTEASGQIYVPSSGSEFGLGTNAARELNSVYITARGAKRYSQTAWSGLTRTSVDASRMATYP